MFAWIRFSDSNILNDSSLQSAINQTQVDISVAIDAISPFIIQNGTTLTISFINATEDGGGYICGIINEAGADLNFTFLYVLPEITIQPMSQYVSIGDNVELNCKGNSFPPPEYQWEILNTTLGVYVPIPMDAGGTNPVLTIFDVEYENFGTFHCVITTPVINETVTSDEVVVTGMLLYFMYMNIFYFIV